jgi:hypothetical protein
MIILQCPFDHQILGLLAFAGPAGLFRSRIICPFFRLHPPSPVQDGLGLYNGYHIGQTVFDSHAVLCQDFAVHLGQWDASAELGSENTIFLSLVVVLQGQLFLKELLDLDQERMWLIGGV